MTTLQPIRIGVLGTHSTGKTMLLKRIEMELRAQGITVERTGRLGKRAAAAGLPKMQHHTIQSTEWIITQGIADEIGAAARGAEVVLLDRAAHDAIAYLRAALEYRGETALRPERERLLTLATTQLLKYHLLLAAVLDESVPVDTGHDYDARYRRLVDQHLHRLLDRDNIPHLRVTSAPDNQAHIIDEAVQSCLKEALV
ncbi:AAA family ATPase [Streptomyces pseudovenezuelae]|uniref:Nicotinamide riboside kinase n=1 Tax=Streptomyces pseudovenezuelae TaxID=67350 RepID=A0ABT6M3L1_9ACTN|nr:AAA family ATPase [Streptomyces pseudovenezuelae]MDH6222700.1 nicotinamide riboside kinase [Streptomyces pseudovenezuelae]